LLIAVPGLVTRAQVQDHPQASGKDDDPFSGVTILERSTLLEAVLERNPSVEAARQAWKAASEGISQASSLDDPMASYSFAPLSFASSDARFGEIVRLSQSIPYPGTLRLRKAAAMAEAAAAEHRIEEIRLHLATAASFLFDDYWLLGRALAITRKHIDLLESFQSVATSRYATGTAPQQAPIQAEVEAAHLLHREVVLRAERRKLVARLNALLHRTTRAPLPPAASGLDVDLVGLGAVEVSASSRPDVAAQLAEIDALRTRVSLTDLRKKPDFEVMTSYNSMWGTSEHRWLVGIGLRLPVWRKRLNASVAEAQARLSAAESELAALTDAVAAEVEAALASVDEATHVVRLYRSRVLPATRDQVAAARAAFETGEGSMLGLIDAQRSLLAAELAYEKAMAGVSSARAELDRALGRMPFRTATEPFESDSTVSPEGDQP